MSKLLIIVIAASALGVVILFCILRHKQALRKELEIKAQDKLREEALNRALRNERSKERAVSERDCLPYEVDYGQNKNPVDYVDKNKIMLQIIEHSELSVRKYILDPDKKIHIGSRNDFNEIVIKDRTVSGQHCEIFLYNKEVYVKDVNSTNGTFLSRKRKQVRIDSRGMKLKTGDRIIVGKTDLQIEVI